MEWQSYNINNIDDNYVIFLDSHPYSGIWHYPEWLNFQLSYGRAKNGFVFTIRENNEIILGGIFLIQRSSYGINFGYIPAGFLYTKISKEIYDFFLLNIAKLAKEFKLVFTQIDSITEYDEKFVNIISLYKNHNLKEKLPIPSYTNILDLNLSLEDLLLGMKPKGRYNIKLAEKKGVTVRKGKVKELSIFYSLLEETTKRDNFRPNPFSYYESMFINLPNAILLFAEHEKDIIAAGIFTYTKRQALYYYGASSNIKRNLMSPYLLQWEAIKIGKEKGCEYYDFMGIADPQNPKDQLIKVTDFKLKFGGKIVRFNPNYHIIHQYLKYNFYKIGKKIYHKIFN